MKWTRDLNRTNTKKLLGENTGQNLHDIKFSNDFLNRTPKAQATKERTKPDFRKIQNLYKRTVKREQVT